MKTFLRFLFLVAVALVCLTYFNVWEGTLVYFVIAYISFNCEYIKEGEIVFFHAFNKTVYQRVGSARWLLGFYWDWK